MDLPKLVTGEAHNPVDVVGVGDSKWGIVTEENRRVTGTLAIQLSLGILLQVLVVVLAVNEKEKEKENKYLKKKKTQMLLGENRREGVHDDSHDRKVA